MKEERYYLVMDKLEQGIILRALNDKRTALMEQHKSTDGIDEMILKVGNAPIKKCKVIEHYAR